MNLKFLSIPFFALLISCNSKQPDAHADADDKFLTEDITIDTKYPASTEELIFPSNGKKIFGFAYLANGKGPHATIILIHGLPGNERNLDMAQSFRRLGYNVFYFNYRGSWGSEGNYKYSNCLEDVKSVVDFITNPKNIEPLRIDTSKIILIGHSLGGGLSLIAGMNDARVKRIVALSIFNPYQYATSDSAKADLKSLIEYIAPLSMLKCNADTFVNEMVLEKDNYNIEELLSKEKNKPILVIDEHQHNQYIKKYLLNKNIEYEVWNTDHGFTNKRIALTKRIVKWLDK